LVLQVIKKRPPGNVIDNYTMRGPELTPTRSKMIVRPEFVNMVAVHSPTSVSAEKRELHDDVLVFNHYFTKSEEDWEIRCRKGTANGNFVVEPPYLPANPDGIQVFDDSNIKKFSIKLKEWMQETRYKVRVPQKHVPQ